MMEGVESNGRKSVPPPPVEVGELEELVHLVGQKQVAADNLHLSDLADQCLSRLRDEAPIDLEAVGETLAFISQLMLAKSSLLLLKPDEDSEDGPALDSLTDWQLAAADIGKRAGFLREREGMETYAAPGRPDSVERRREPRSPSSLRRVWQEIQQRRHDTPFRLAVPAFVRLETAVSGLTRHLRSAGRVSFQRWTARRSRQDAVTHFLAILELLRRGTAAANQPHLFDDIEVELVEPGTDSAARAG